MVFSNVPEERDTEKWDTAKWYNEKRDNEKRDMQGSRPGPPEASLN